MVRLKGHCQPLQTWPVDMFQFHNGTIKSNLTCQHSQKFQFHNGTIKSSYAHGFQLCRLLFQFHNGTIKRVVENIKKLVFSDVSIP